MKYDLIRYLIIPMLTIQSFAIDLSAYTNLLEKVCETPWISLDKENFTWNDYPSDVKNKFLAGVDAQNQLRNIAACESLTQLFLLLEQGWGRNRPCLVYYENLGYRTNFYFEIIYKQIANQNGLSFGSDPYGNIAFPWLDYDKYDECFNDCEVQYFWWIYDRKHMPEIWESWYSCWKKENASDKPRKMVVNHLAYDISRLGFYAFPFLYLNISNGDKSLLEVVAYYRKGLAYPHVLGDFMEWWDKNKKKYNLPEVQGWERSEPLIKEKKIPLRNKILISMPKWHELAEKYYKSPKNAYWYFFLEEKDDITEEDIQNALIKSVTGKFMDEDK